MTATRSERTARRLLNSSAQRWYDPEVDFHPEHRVSLYGTELWKRLTPAQRHELGKQEIAAIASFGIAAEVGLMSMPLKFVMRSDIASAEAQYALTEIADECRHSTMFARSSWYLDSTGVDRTSWPGFTWRYWPRTRRITPADLDLTGSRTLEGASR